MPYSHEHSGRLEDPDKYDVCRRENDKFGAGIDAVFCKKAGGDMELQAIRFDAARFTAAEARAWLKAHGHKTILFEPAAETKAAFLLSLQTDPAQTAGMERREGDVPIRRYRKELIRSGQYVKATDDVAFEVTDATLDHWVGTFAQWTRAGNKVPVPLTHRDPSNPDQNRGWLVDLYRDEHSLIGILDLVGEDAAQLALTSDVSIFVPPETTDGKGNVYVRPITHVALCTDPVIPGLAGFESIAASLQQTGNTEEKTMKEIAVALGLDEAATVEDILAAIAKLKKGGEESAKKAEEVEASLTAKVDELTKTKDALELSLKPRTPDPLLVKLASENRGMKLDALVAAARITPAVKAKLAERYVKAEALSLSLAKGDDGFDELIAILAENDPVKLKEQTGPQVLSLGGGPGGKDTPNAIQQDVARRRQAAGLKDGK